MIVRRNVNSLEKTATHYVKLSVAITAKNMSSDAYESARVFYDSINEFLKEKFDCEVDIAALELYEKTW